MNKPTNITLPPSREEAMHAVKTLLDWAGDDHTRPGLQDTPQRVVDAYREWFSGYLESPEEYLTRTFDDVDGYQDVVLVKDIPFTSFCEHHLAPIIGTAHVAYLPSDRVVGLSKLARLVRTFARRLQVQERMTAQIASTLQDVLNPEGVAVLIKAEHHCMSTRGVHVHGTETITTEMTGAFRDDPDTRNRFFELLKH